MSARSHDRNLMYRLIKRLKLSSKEETDVLEVNGTTYTGPDQVRLGWLEHYRALAQPSPGLVKTDYDNRIALDHNFLRHYCDTTNNSWISLSSHDVVKAVQSLNTGRSADADGLTAEHFRYAGQAFYDILTTILNQIGATQQVPSLLKRGLVTSVHKKKPPITKPQNHRGITVTMVLCKILETILKWRLDPILESVQHPLQRGFTAGVSPIYAAFIIQELQNEARDNSTPLYVAYLDAKSAFDTVWISSLMCKLHDAGINGDLWMLIDNLHTEVTSQIKWKGALSNKFNINQGVRQGGVLSTGEYKGFNNNLLFKLTSSLSGSRLGSIQCGAPTCADDIAVVADSPVDLQILLDIAAEYSHSEHYELQPAKCVVFPFNSTASLDWPWEILGHELPIVDTTTHIGVKRDRPSGGLLSTIDNNITKARGAAYSVLGAGFHGVSGLNPVTTTHVWQVYVLPVLTYGLELFNIPERLITKLETFQNKIVKQLLGLTNGTPQCAILLLTGLPTIEVVLHLKVLGMLWNIINANYSIENSILLRQLAVKDWSSNSWLVYVRKLLSRYDLPTIYSLMDDLPSRRHWKRLVEKMVFRCSEDTMEQRLTLYTSLRFLHGEPYRIGTPHIIIDSVLPSVMDVRRSATKLRLVTGTYSLQANRPAFNQHFSPTCLLCKSEPETREHFICSCSALEKVRQSGLTELQEVLPPNIDVMLLTSGDLLQLLLNCRPLMASVSCPTTRYAIESVTRRLCYRLHNERFTKLNGLSRHAKVPLYAIQETGAPI